MANERRYRVSYVAYQDVVSILRGEVTVEQFDVPEGAQVVGVFYNDPCMALGVIFAHPSFEHTPLGMVLPSLPPLVLRRHE